MVRAKFECIAKDPYDGSGYWDAKNQKEAPAGTQFFRYRFQVVVSGSKENEDFFASSPGGTLELYAVRLDEFEVGKTYYLDFTLATKDGQTA